MAFGDFQSVYGSSNVTGIRYDPETRTVQVQFRGGSVYSYFDVPAQTFQEFVYAPSKGRFVNLVLRRSHRYRRES